MAQIELIHWGCKGTVSEIPPVKIGRISYMCAVCGAIFVYGENGLEYWFNIMADEVTAVLEKGDPNIDIAELAREISCEGRVM